MGLLSLLVCVPLVGAFLVLLLPNEGGLRDGVVRRLALGVSLAVFALTLLVWSRFDPSDGRIYVRGSLGDLVCLDHRGAGDTATALAVAAPSGAVLDVQPLKPVPLRFELAV